MVDQLSVPSLNAAARHKRGSGAAKVRALVASQFGVGLNEFTGSFLESQPAPSGQLAPQHQLQYSTQLNNGLLLSQLSTELQGYLSGSIVGTTTTAPDEAMLFWDALETYAARNQIKKAILSVFEKIDPLLHRGAFNECDALLNRASTQALPMRILFAFLTITDGVPESQLPSRARLAAIVRKKASRELGDDRTRALFDSV